VPEGTNGLIDRIAALIAVAVVSIVVVIVTRGTDAVWKAVVPLLVLVILLWPR
jgi:hypothetical protein